MLLYEPGDNPTCPIFSRFAYQPKEKTISITNHLSSIQLTYNYPAVAKTLRDNFTRSDAPHAHTDHKHDPHTHMCGMMAMQSKGGVTGYHDLNELMREPKDIEFVIELLEVTRPEGYDKEAWQMDAEEKLGKIPELREEGNRLFREKKTREAAEKYSLAIGMLEQLMLR